MKNLIEFIVVTAALVALYVLCQIAPKRQRSTRT
jgi:hypothetical protein